MIPTFTTVRHSRTLDLLDAHQLYYPRTTTCACIGSSLVIVGEEWMADAGEEWGAESASAPTADRESLVAWGEKRDVPMTMISVQGQPSRLCMGMHSLLLLPEDPTFTAWTRLVYRKASLYVLPWSVFWGALEWHERTFEGKASQYLTIYQDGAYRTIKRNEILRGFVTAPVVHWASDTEEDAEAAAEVLNSDDRPASLITAEGPEPVDQGARFVECLCCGLVLAIEVPRRICDQCRDCRVGGYGPDEYGGFHGNTWGAILDNATNRTETRAMSTKKGAR